MTTLYLAGPMRGIPEFNVPAFFEAEARLVSAGFNVINPARRDVDNLRATLDEMRHPDG